MSVNHKAQATSILMKNLNDIDGANLEFKSIVKRFFEGPHRKWVLKATFVPGGVLVLLNLKYDRSRRERHVELVFIPYGCCFKSDPIVSIDSASIPARFDPRDFIIFATFDKLTTGHEKAYLPFAQQVLKTLGRFADRVTDAISVPNGFLAEFSGYSGHPEGLWLYTVQPLVDESARRQVSELHLLKGAVTTQTKIESNEPTSSQSVYDEAIRLQLTVKNACMHTPTYRFNPCTLRRSMTNGALDLSCSLIGLSTDVNYVDIEGNTALHEAALQTAGSFVIGALLEAGADLKFKNADKCSAMHVAIKNRNATALVGLLEGEVDVPFVFGSYAAAIDYCKGCKAFACADIIGAHNAKVEALRAIQIIRDELNL
jgi:hypothetical protein